MNDDLETQWREIIRRNREAFLGKYRQEVNALLGVSRSDIDAITPDSTDLQVYDALIEVVKEASRQNLAQADLRNRIRSLGEVAVKIAEHVPSLAAILE